MTRVFVGIGSNTEREQHVRIAVEWLHAEFENVRFSPVFESAAIGFDGRPFLNLVAQLDTTLAVGELLASFKSLEYDYGREPDAPRFTARNIDLDILTYGDAIGRIDGIELPRAEVLYNAFVLWPLAELAGASLHPVTGKSYASHWAEFDQSSQQLTPIEFPLPT
ncbi:MAG: 2-amino-4-hydroxy-6-hydroxymethyldihydropteridine diphosphokinase [Halieaceae bacterium]|jgi:2-amino-4-hydroxy-6-hydroxymethyldihydropteridine diphosphokinase